MTAAMVYCGLNSDNATIGALPMTIVTAIVSPRARPRPSMIAPMMPVLPKPIATLIASQRVAPSAYAASRWALGTFFKISRATDDVNGTTMIERMIAAAPMPTPTGGPENSAIFRSDSGISSSSLRTIGVSTKMPQSP